MKLDQSLVSLKLSQKIEKLGVKQDSLWYWMLPLRYNSQWKAMLKEKLPLSYKNKYQRVKNRVCSAFTVAELGEMLPYDIKNHWSLEFHKYRQRYTVVYYHPHDPIIIEANTFANALAKMLIYIVENKLMKL